MTPFPYTIGLDEPIERAAALMEEHGVRHLPVEHERTLVGFLTQRDLLRGAGGRVRDVVVAEPYVVELTASLEAVARHMSDNQIGSALVVRGDRLAGIFTVTDACRTLAEILAAAFEDPDDEAA